LKKPWGWAAVAAALALFLALSFLFASRTDYFRLYRSGGPAKVSYERAVVLEVEKEELEADKEHGGLLTGYQDILVRIESGERAGSELPIENVLNYTTHFLLTKGQSIVLHVDSADAAHYTVSLYSVDRAPALAILGCLFVAALCGVGGRRGARSFLGMLFTLAAVAFVMIPLLFRGFSPILAACLIVAATISVSLLLLAGPSAKSASAIAGSIVGIAVSAGIALLFQSLVQVSGYTSAEADSLLAISAPTGMRVGELLFASFLISTLGAEMDIAISVASAVSEVAVSNPSLGRAGLFRAGMNVGRDMMGTMANTLILAFAGSSLNSMILIYSIERSARQILNSNAVATEIVQSLGAGLAVIVTVPAVAWFAALLLARGRRVAQESPAPGVALRASYQEHSREGEDRSR
jgi:Predicted multitransmembrane protein